MSTKTTAPTYMFVFRNPAAMPDPTPEQMQQIFQQWRTWIDGIKAKGIYLAGDPLEDAPAKVLRSPRGAKIIDGPFAEAKEIVAGYVLLKSKTFAEAVRISKGCPGLLYGGSVEVRQLMPMPS
jgi:hypothetical protein